MQVYTGDALAICPDHDGADGPPPVAGADGKLTATIVYRDERGRPQRVTVTTDQARQIRTIRQQYRRLEKRWRERTVSFTDAGIDPRGLASSLAGRPSQAGYPPEPPFFTFAALLGQGWLWNGPRGADLEARDAWEGKDRPGPAESKARRKKKRKKREARPPCAVCGGGFLTITTCCLACLRTGRDMAIPPVTREDLARRNKAPREEDGLEGGLGGKK